MDLSDCTLCPRSCRVNRLAGRIGYCNVTADLFAARAALYYHEEPVISGSRGSGAVFFAGCNMGCVFCQNYAIAKAMTGTQLSSGRLTEIFLSLQEQGAHNINLITAEHFLPQVIRSLRDAKDQGLTLPVVYNTGTYERVEAIQALEGLVDVWLPDFKYISPRLSLAYSHTPDYFQYASKALQEMVRQCPEPLFSDGSHTLDAPDDADDPLMVRGVLVRHLVLPGSTQDSMDILKYLHDTYGDQIFISIMNQYTPMPQVKDDPDLGRKLSSEEYEKVVDYAISLGITNGFIQEEGTASRRYIPAFDGTGI
ncbi:MAG: 4Fe-4S cluster-binding domain-containing protein [Lachnospiraceae bacterium]|jgi:putative pyruvate formate lyase activating enzyme|nr:4Fe-4S cluster-binding domain-containing protein [Lachnospiraceae bacterium]